MKKPEQVSATLYRLSIELEVIVKMTKFEELEPLIIESIETIKKIVSELISKTVTEEPTISLKNEIVSSLETANLISRLLRCMLLKEKKAAHIVNYMCSFSDCLYPQISFFKTEIK
jgi:hypothetical protein